MTTPACSFAFRSSHGEEWMPVHYGYEVQIDNEPEKSGEDDHHVTGTLYSLTKAHGSTR